jgi:hypothetical protein
MKKIILSSIISSALLIGVVGCGDNSSKSTNHKSVQKVEKKLSIEDRKKALLDRIQGYSKYGFDINKTSDTSYTLSVKEPQKTVELFLNVFSLGYSVEEEDKESLAELFKDAKFDVAIDWEKYLSDAKNSVEVDYVGKGDESKAIQKLLSDKKVGAYLTYDNTQLKKVIFKELDDTISENNESLHILLKDTVVDIDALPNENSTKRVYTIKSKEVNIGLKDEYNTTATIGYKDLECNTDKSNAYLGTQDCKIPTVEIIFDKSSKDEIKTTLNNLVYKYVTRAKNAKVDEDISIKLDSIKVNKEFAINNIKADIKAANISENIIKEYMQLMENPSNNPKKDIPKMMKLAGEIYSNGATMEYKVTVADIKGSGEGIDFELDNFQEAGNGKFDSNITYNDKATIKSIKISDATNKANAFELNNFRFGYGIYDLYNLLPETMDMLGVISTETNETKIENIVQNDALKLGQKLVNQGLGIYIKPLGYDGLKFSDVSSKTNYNLGKTDIELDVKLLKNDLKLDINNPMMPMMLLGYLKVNGKIVIPAKDLQLVSKNPAFAMVGMLMMMAKIEGDNAVFVIKYENGKLLVNGQPMM